jgi:hypothetical protein
MYQTFKIVVALAILSILQTTANASENGRQIRLDANTCSNIMPEYVRKKNNPLYAKAIAAQKMGHANDMQRRRIAEVQFLYDTLRFARCKGV